MSDYHDYYENLAFPPQGIKSQHELSEQGRQSDVLIKAIEKCQKLEAENQQLKELLSKARDSVQFDYYEAIGGGADYQAKFLKDLLTAIDNAIGEKK